MFQHKLCGPPKKNTSLSLVHPGRLTWNIQITHLERNIIFQTPMIMFHGNLQGCNCKFEKSTSLSLPPWKLTHPLKHDGWKMHFLLKSSLFRGHVSFLGCSSFLVTVLRVLPVTFARPPGAGDGHSFGWKSYRPYRSPGATREQKRTESTPEINGVSWFPY